MTRSREELLAAARAWIEGDPDPATAAELRELLQRADVAELAQRLEPLSFGTAGLRGAVGAGSGRMNLAVVVRTAFGIAQYLRAAAAQGPIVIGFDARPTSRALAEASAGVLLAAGFEVVAHAEPIATPLVAFLGRELAAALSIVVTASHNPRGDNGYKVYGSQAVQIVSPVDQQIAAEIARAPAARLVPRWDVRFGEQRSWPGLGLVTASQENGYFEALGRALPGGSARRDLAILHSALHGVGSAPMRRALSEAGFSRVSSVAEQAEPDGTFPTTPFPNPEEPGTLDLALAQAREQHSELLLVSDPDADRLAAAARLDGEIEVLDGNQVGVLLADATLASATREAVPLVLGSVVSSPLVEALCRARGARYERTHTGFKWLWTAALELERQHQGRFCFGFEEALGYSVFPDVRDKDGISAGRCLAELAASLAALDKSLFDRLFELYTEHGLWASAARNVTLSGVDALSKLSGSLDALVAAGAFDISGERVTKIVDYRTGANERPAWLGGAPLLELRLESGGRLFVRPSGTEPKLKLYAHVRHIVTQRSELAVRLAEARQSAAALLFELERALRL